MEAVDLDFLDEKQTLATELGKTRFDATAATVFISEGLIMYLGESGKLKLIADVSAVAAPGSVVFVLQFMDASAPQALSVEEATRELNRHGWEKLEFTKFGDKKLDFGRYPRDRFKPNSAFSFCVCSEAAVRRPLPPPTNKN